MLFRSIVLVTVGLVYLGLIDSLWQFYLAFVLISLGISSAGGSVGTVAVSWWFVRQRSRALSLFFIGPGLAGITVRLLAWLVEQFGWRHAVQGWGVIVLLACLPMTLLLRERPEKYGLTPDGDAPHRPADAHGAAPVVTSRTGISFRQALRMSHYWKLGLVFALTGLSATPVIILVVPALTNVGVSYETAAWVAAGVNACFFSGDTCWGRIDPRPSSRGVPARVFSRIDAFGPRLPGAEAWAGAEKFPYRTPSESELIGARNVPPVTGGGPWVCSLPEHWIFAGTGMRKGDGIPGLVGWEWMGRPAPIPGLEVVSTGPTRNAAPGPAGEGVYAATIYPGPRGNFVFNAATCWWADGLSAPPGYVRPKVYTEPKGPDPRVRTITRNILDRICRR